MVTEGPRRRGAQPVDGGNLWLPSTVGGWTTVPVCWETAGFRRAQGDGEDRDSHHLGVRGEGSPDLHLQQVDNRDAVGEWQSFEIVQTDILDIVRGRTLHRSWPESGTDAEDMASFWVDSLKLVAECGR